MLDPDPDEMNADPQPWRKPMANRHALAHKIFVVQEAAGI
jgi:hypothetical protein